MFFPPKGPECTHCWPPMPLNRSIRHSALRGCWCDRGCVSLPTSLPPPRPAPLSLSLSLSIPLSLYPSLSLRVESFPSGATGSEEEGGGGGMWGGKQISRAALG